MRPGQPDWYPLVSRAMDGGPDASGKLVLAFGVRDAAEANDPAVRSFVRAVERLVQERHIPGLIVVAGCIHPGP
jgi:hypothetical protein